MQYFQFESSGGGGGAADLIREPFNTFSRSMYYTHIDTPAKWDVKPSNPFLFN